MTEMQSAYHIAEEEFEAPRVSEPPSAQPSPSNSVLRERQHANLPPRPPKPPQTPKQAVQTVNAKQNVLKNNTNLNVVQSEKKQNLLTLLPPSEKAKVGQLIKQLVKEKTEKENVKQELSALTSKFEGKVANLRENNMKMKRETESLKKKFSQSLGMIQAYQNELLLRDQSERSMNISESEGSPCVRRRSGSVSSSYARNKSRGATPLRGARVRHRSWSGRAGTHVNSSHADAEDGESSIEVVDSSCQVDADLDEPPALVSRKTDSAKPESSPERHKHAVQSEVKSSSEPKSSLQSSSERKSDQDKVVGIEDVAEALTEEQFSLLQKYMKLRGQELKAPTTFASGGKQKVVDDVVVKDTVDVDAEPTEQLKVEPKPMPQQQQQAQTQADGKESPPLNQTHVVAVPVQLPGGNGVHWVQCVQQGPLDSTSVLVPISPAVSIAQQAQPSEIQKDVSATNIIEANSRKRSVSPSSRSPKRPPFRVPPANINHVNDTLVKVGKSRWVDPPSPKPQSAKMAQPKNKSGGSRNKNQVWVAKRAGEVPAPKRRPPQRSQVQQQRQPNVDIDSGPRFVQYQSELHQPTHHRPADFDTNDHQDRDRAINHATGLDETHDLDDYTLVGSPVDLQLSPDSEIQHDAYESSQQCEEQEMHSTWNHGNVGGLRAGAAAVGQRFGMREPQPDSSLPPSRPFGAMHGQEIRRGIRRPRPQHYGSASSNAPHGGTSQVQERQEYTERESDLYSDSPQMRPRQNMHKTGLNMNTELSFDDVPATPDFPHHAESSWSPPPRVPARQLQSTTSSDVGPLLAALEPQLRNNPAFQQSIEDGLRLLQSQADRSCFSFCHNGDGPPTFGKGFTDSLASNSVLKSGDHYDPSRHLQFQTDTPEFPSSSYTTPEQHKPLPRPPAHHLETDSPYYRKSIINLISTFFQSMSIPHSQIVY